MSEVRSLDIPAPAPAVPPHNFEAEMAALGIALYSAQGLTVLRGVLRPEMFADDRHGAIWQALCAMQDSGQPANVIGLKAWAERQGDIGQLGGWSYLAKLAGSVVTVFGAQGYARLIEDLWQRRRLMAIYANAAARVADVDPDRPPTEILAALDAEVGAVFDGGGDGAPATAKRAIESALDAADAANKGVVAALPTGLAKLDAVIGGLPESGLVILGGRPGMGKAQALDAPVLLADGTWRAMGDLRRGDALASIDGAASRVTGVFPQGKRPIFRVTLSDGRSTRCCGEHLWRVRHRAWPEEWRPLATSALVKLLAAKRNRNRLSVPLISGRFGTTQRLPLDPWLLGFWLANGSASSKLTPLMTCPTAAARARVAGAIGPGQRLQRAQGNIYRIVSRDRRYALGRALATLGLSALRSEHRFIPPGYLAAPYDQRMALIRGLMDGDGWIERSGSARYSTSSQGLARDIVTLIRSIGGTCAAKVKQPFYTYRGERLEGLPHYVCRIRLRSPRDLLSPGPKARTAPKSNRVQLNIASIEPDGTAPTQCIAVSHPTQLYVTDDYIVTHNTALAVRILYAVARRGIACAMFSLEMSTKELGRRLLAGTSGVPLNTIARPPGPSVDEWIHINRAAQDNEDLPITFDDRPGPQFAQLRARAKSLARQHKLGLVVVDHLALVAVPPEVAQHGAVERIGFISNGLKRLAKELGCPVLALCQLSRAVEGRDDKRPTLADLRWAGEIEQDADVVLFPFREHYYAKRDYPQAAGTESDEAYQRRLETWQAEMAHIAKRAEIIVAKQRDGDSGVARLAFDAPTVWFDDAEGR